MAQPVWVLSVDLQTKTATFQSGMADAAKSAKGAFNDIRSGAGEMGRETSFSMTEARHSVMILGEEFGVRLPRALTSFVAGLGPVGAAMEAAFPFLAIILGATLLLEHLSKMREEADKLTEAQAHFLTATNNAFNALDQKILEAGIKTDELNKNHLGALKKQLELIDKQSMEELAHSFDVVAKAAEGVFAELKNHWYTTGIGADGAKSALSKFKAEYDSLLSQGRNKEAADLLSGTLNSAEKVLAFQRQYLANQADASGKTNKNADYTKFEEAALALKTAGVGVTENEITAQQQLVDALQRQLTIEDKVNQLKTAQKGNARTSTAHTENEEAYRQLKAQMDAERAEQEQEEKEQEEAHNRAISRLQQSEREKIEATERGSAARLAAIDAALKEEEKFGLQETGFYQSLATSRVETVREMATEESRLKADAGREAAEHAAKMGELELAATQEADKLRMSSTKQTDQEIAAEATKAANEDFAIKKKALDDQIAALDKGARDYENKLKALQDKESELTKAHENELTAIKDRAEIERNQHAVAAMVQLENIFAKGLTGVIMRHQTFAQMVSQIGDQVLSGMVENAIKSAMMMDFGKEKDAAKAAREMFIAGTKFPFPANIVMAPTLGAMAFASMMAFADGGIVPGAGNFDSVPAILTPGEHVSDKSLTEGLRRMVSEGPANNRPPVHVHVRPTYHVNTIDGDGMQDALNRHSDVLVAHVERTLRRFGH